ncbi:MAG: PH domain-containing protein [Alphaproteobacteria bacterium]|nr:PH domain-containing protein [Alphaproteobacteria bacterium]
MALLMLIGGMVSDDTSDTPYIIFWIIFFGWYALWNFLRYNSVEMVVTNKRAVLKKGIFIHDTNELRLEKIESVNIKKSLFGLIFGYGDIIFTGTGGKIVKFQAISQPQKIKNDIDEIFEKYTK